MAFKAKRCWMVIPRTGERCRQPSLKGKQYCRFHVEAGEASESSGADLGTRIQPERGEDRAGETAKKSRAIEQATPAAGDKDRVSSTVGKSRRGARRGNRNARRHGLFSTRMPSDEKKLYEENKRLFSEQLEDLNTFDELVVHLLALVSTKLDVAAAGGASPQNIIPLSNEVLRLLRSLKETRDSRDEEEAGTPKTFADFLAEVEALGEAEGLPTLEEEARKRVIELEKEVNELRQQLKLPQRKDIGHRKTLCARCGKETSQRLNLAGEWICLACGVDVGTVSSGPSTPAVTKKTAPATSPKASSATKQAQSKPAQPKRVNPKPSPPSSTWAYIPPSPRNE